MKVCIVSKSTMGCESSKRIHAVTVVPNNITADKDIDAFSYVQFGIALHELRDTKLNVSVEVIDMAITYRYEATNPMVEKLRTCVCEVLEENVADYVGRVLVP